MENKMVNPMPRIYKLLKDYESPTSTIKAGAEGSMSYWHGVFPDLFGKDPLDYPEWFQLIQEEPKDVLMNAARNEKVNWDKDVFIWDRDEVFAFMEDTFSKIRKNAFILSTVGASSKLMDEWKQSKSSSIKDSKERIEVRRLKEHDNFKGNGADTFWFQFSASKPIDMIRWKTQIEQAIESVLNNEGVYSNEIKYWMDSNVKYSQIELDKEREDAFIAARETDGKIIGRGEYNDGDWDDLYKDKYPTFNDYLQSLNSKNKVNP